MEDKSASQIDIASISSAATPPPGLLLAGHFSEQPGYHVRRAAGTRDWLITYTCAGEGRYLHAAGARICRAGDLLLLAPGAPHDYAAAAGAQPWDFYWAHFTPRTAWAPWLRLPEAGPGLHALSIADLDIRQRMIQACERMLRDSRGLGLLQQELALNALEELLILAAQQHMPAGARQLDQRVERVLRRMSEDFSARLSIADLAGMVALSPSRLAHLFKAQVGEPIAELHTKLRLRQAARLLELTSRSVGEIAQDVGFQSPFAFSRQFKVYYGVSPTAYRKRFA
jgi:AraC family transcriptional regulator of arabinose operon